MTHHDDLIRDTDTIRPASPRPAPGRRHEPESDPYAAPPRHRDRSGVLVRLAIAAVLLAGAGFGYAHIASQPVQPLVAEEPIGQPTQQFAQTDPGLIESSPSDFSTAPIPAPQAAPAPRRAAPPAAAAPAEPAPVDPPVIEPATPAPTAIEPLPPIPQGE